jgi:biopolymer transport protein ExbB/TolQ
MVVEPRSTHNRPNRSTHRARRLPELKLRVACSGPIFNPAPQEDPLPSTVKPKKRASARPTSSRNGNSAKKTSASPRTHSASSRSRAASAKSRAAKNNGVSQTVESVTDTVGDTVGPIGSTVDSVVEKARNGARTVAKGAAAATVATAAAAIAGRALISSRRRKRVLGVPMPRRQTSMKGLAKQFSGMAGDLEKKTLDVSNASGRVKQAANILS